MAAGSVKELQNKGGSFGNTEQGTIIISRTTENL